MTESNSHDSKSPGVHYPPPLIFVAGFGLGGLVNKLAPIGLGLEGSRTASIIAIAVAGLGLTIMLISIVTFLKNRTPVYPNSPARHLVVTGPYKFSRNPMYSGLSILYIGGSFMVNSIWPLVLLPAVIWTVYRLVITKEEAHLRHLFGQKYDAYANRVRRWI